MTLILPPTDPSEARLVVLPLPSAVGMATLPRILPRLFGPAMMILCGVVLWLRIEPGFGAEVAAALSQVGPAPWLIAGAVSGRLAAPGCWPASPPSHGPCNRPRRTGTGAVAAGTVAAGTADFRFEFDGPTCEATAEHLPRASPGLTLLAPTGQTLSAASSGVTRPD